jgi:serine/threonine protein kinase
MIGETVSHYKILEKLGEGGMGVVYKALDTTLDRDVAIKFLPPQMRSDTEAKKRFMHEAKAASALNHSNIAVIHEIDETPEGQMFIVMAYYDGQTLKDKLENGPLPVDEAIDIVSQIASGLAKAHEQDILHRDIKPANILIEAAMEAENGAQTPDKNPKCPVSVRQAGPIGVSAQDIKLVPEREVFQGQRTVRPQRGEEGT